MIDLPRPGITQLHIKQNHANPIGSTGIAPFITDVLSTSDSSIFGRISSGAMVTLCFLLFMLVRRLSGGGFGLQHAILLKSREQQFLMETKANTFHDCFFFSPILGLLRNVQLGVT